MKRSSTSHTTSDPEEEGCPDAKRSNPERAKSGAAAYLTSFQVDWSKEWPFISKGTTHHHFWCSICRVERSCGHQGKRDIERHIQSDGHVKKVDAVKYSRSIKKFFVTAPTVDKMTALETKVRRAEVKVATTMVKHNIPLAFADHLSPLFREIFPDSEIAKAYGSGKTKTTCILNGALKPHYQSQLVQLIREKPYSISIDGSNDTGREKMNPMTVKVFDINGVTHRFLDMCTTSGKGAGTAEIIFEKMNSVLQKHGIPWCNCICLSVDNTSVNLGSRNSLYSRIVKENPSVYVLGCPCHILHNTCGKAASGVTSSTGFDIEEVAIDVAYWFDKSTKRKAGLEEFCIFCDTTYKDVVAHTSTRWLSLEKAVTRILELYASLVSYFKSSSEPQARYTRLQEKFSDCMTEVYLLFYQSVFPLFTRFNLLLQREDPAIYLLYSQMKLFLKSLMSRFIKPQVMIDAHDDVAKINYQDSSNQLDNSKLYLGMITRSTLNRLINEGDVSPHEVDKFMQGVRTFYTTAVSYALTHLPLDDVLLQNAQFVNIKKRVEADYSQVTYFVERFSDLLPYSDVNSQELLFTQFTQYQTMQDTAIPTHVWNDAKIREKNDGEKVVEYYRMDILWAYLDTVEDEITGQPSYSLLAKVAKLVLTLPHSNADEERVFSLVRQNKTNFRSALTLDGTLASILTVKMANPEPCYKFEPPADVIKQSKKVTWEYNKEHSSAGSSSHTR